MQTVHKGRDNRQESSQLKDEKKKRNFFWEWAKDLNGHITEDIGMVNKYKMPQYLELL